MSNKETTLKVNGMTCHSCEEKITNSVLKIDGINDISFSNDRSLVTISAVAKVDEKQVKEAIAGAGDYTVIDTDSMPESDSDTSHEMESEDSESLYPLFLIVGYILLTTLIIEFRSETFSVMTFMPNFMAAFFLVFSFFKLLDLPGFVSAYMSYDLIAKKIPVWGWIYPFVELSLGVLYLLQTIPTIINAITLALMLVGAVGVLKALLDKRTIQCACLGTALNLPMTKVTLLEDLLMAGMAGAALIL